MQMVERPHRCEWGCCTAGYGWRRGERRWLKRRERQRWQREINN
jgi:hypothetical protein